MITCRMGRKGIFRCSAYIGEFTKNTLFSWVGDVIPFGSMNCTVFSVRWDNFPTPFYAMLKRKFAMLLSYRSLYFTILIIFHYFNYRYAYASFFNRLCVTYLSGHTSFRVSLRPIVVCPGGVSGIWQEKSCRAVKRAVIYFVLQKFLRVPDFSTYWLPFFNLPFILFLFIIFCYRALITLLYIYHFNALSFILDVKVP